MNIFQNIKFNTKMNIFQNIKFNTKMNIFQINLILK